MIKLSISYLCVLICIQVLLHCDALNFRRRDLRKWNFFKTRHSKLYKTVEEEIRRMKIFIKNEIKIAKHNRRFRKGKETYELGTNEFSDLTKEEFAKLYLIQLPINQTRRSKAYTFTPDPSIEDVPDYKNWAEEGFVTSVKKQGLCGSCWAFSAVGAIEAHAAIAGGQLQNLSTQHLLDCVGRKAWTPNSCRGGMMEFGYRYVVRNGGIATASSYPYTGRQGKCRYHPDFKGATIQGYKAVEPDEEAIKQVVGTIGPVSAAVFNADLLQNYRSGIFRDPDCGISPINGHAILIVGYGTDEAGDYWLLKNSWTPKWGINGFGKIARNVNMCQIQSYVHFPTGAQ